jgi:TatA/E family protein of Tat protein translocase
MLDLGPTKLLVIFVVIVVLLGPDKLPQVARQLGSGWRRLRQLQERMEAELRETVPDLPSTQEIARFARSPTALLSRLSDLTQEEPVADPGAPARGGDVPDAGGRWPEDPAVATSSVDGLAPVPMTAAAVELPDDPSMN